jgi:hypothetical protein
MSRILDLLAAHSRKYYPPTSPEEETVSMTDYEARDPKRQPQPQPVPAKPEPPESEKPNPPYPEEPEPTPQKPQ